MGASTFLSFRNRPVAPNVAIFNQVQQAQRYARSYQHQHVTLTGAYVLTTSLTTTSFTGYSLAPLMPGDTVVSATVAVTNMTGGTYDVEINGTLRGANLGGTWSLAPNLINMKAYAVPATDSPQSGRLYVRLKNTGAGTITQVEFQLVVVVLR